MTLRRTLSVLLTQLQFESLQVAAAVAKAGVHFRYVQRKTGNLGRLCDRMSGELSDALCQATLNPSLVAAMRTQYRQDLQGLWSAERELADAQLRDDELRTAFAELRNRERSLERALAAQQHEHQVRLRKLDITVADDLWLQRRRAS